MEIAQIKVTQFKEITKVEKNRYLIVEIPISLSKDRKISANKLKRLATNVEILYPKIFRYKSGFTSYKAQSKPPVLTLSVDAQDVHEHALHHKKHTGRDLDLSRYDPLYYKQLLDKEEL